ncbi:MAG: thiamine phosphate synthase [Planctomycetes bacterium]|nr:thiamine phosphate synthase [Planctomycetota bacterium]
MPDSFGLYLVLTDPLAGYETCAEAAVGEGLRYIQLRMKDRPPEEVLAVGRHIREITRRTSTRFIMNDYVALAREVDADGVHLGQEDTPLPEARRLWPVRDRIFGLSTHSEKQAAAAEELHPDYIGVGPVFPTPTKRNPDPVLGLVRMQDIVSRAGVTTVAIGGINADNLPDVLSHGAVNFCVVRYVNDSRDPRSAIRELMDIWKSFRL